VKKYPSDSPLFSDLLYWLEKKNTRRLRGFFPLRSYSTWMRTRPGWRPASTNLNKYREVIRRELIEPLFVLPRLRVRFESDIPGHRKDNAYCCIEFYRRQLRRARAADLEIVLGAFKEDFQRALPGASRFPFSWMIDHRDPVAKEWDELVEREQDFDRKLKLDYRDAHGAELHELAERDEAANWAFDREEKDLTWARDLGLSNERKRGYALRYCEWLLGLMKAARGKPGRHPKEFNVLVYHVIKKCTTRKLNWKWRAAGLDPYVYRNRKTLEHQDQGLAIDPNLAAAAAPQKRKDRQHRLETNWKLVMFLLLDLHVHGHEFPELARFISRHKRGRADVALRSLQAWLLNIRKNFPRKIHGWPMNKEGFPEPETGFRKAIITDEGSLRIVQL